MRAPSRLGGIMPIAFRAAEKPSQCPEVVFVDGHNPMELRFQADPDGYWLAFWALPTIHASDDGEPVAYRKAGAVVQPTETVDPDDAETLIHGTVKWDGCADYEIGDERQGIYRMHACGRRHALAVAEAINHAYDRAAKLDRWDGE